MTLPRCATGIAELDQLLRGGIPRGNIVLVAGAPGLGKTTLAMECLVHGAEQQERGLMVAVGEPIASLERNLREFTFFDPRLFADATIRMADLDAVLGRPTTPWTTLDDPEAVVEGVARLAERGRCKRVAIDSVTELCRRLADPSKVPGFLRALREALAGAGCTTLLVTQTPPRAQVYATLGEDAIADGIVLLADVERHNDLVRTLQVVKMRGTEHGRARFMVDLSEHGIALAPLIKHAGDLGPWNVTA